MGKGPLAELRYVGEPAGLCFFFFSESQHLRGALRVFYMIWK
jgi:hypothetical protein